MTRLGLLEQYLSVFGWTESGSLPWHVRLVVSLAIYSPLLALDILSTWHELLRRPAAASSLGSHEINHLVIWLVPRLGILRSMLLVCVLLSSGVGLLDSLILPVNRFNLPTWAVVIGMGHIVAAASNMSQWPLGITVILTDRRFWRRLLMSLRSQLPLLIVILIGYGCFASVTEFFGCYSNTPWCAFGLGEPYSLRMHIATLAMLGLLFAGIVMVLIDFLFRQRALEGRRNYLAGFLGAPVVLIFAESLDLWTTFKSRILGSCIETDRYLAMLPLDQFVASLWVMELGWVVIAVFYGLLLYRWLRIRNQSSRSQAQFWNWMAVLGGLILAGIGAVHLYAGIHNLNACLGGLL